MTTHTVTITDTASEAAPVVVGCATATSLTFHYGPSHYPAGAAAEVVGRAWTEAESMTDAELEAELLPAAVRLCGGHPLTLTGITRTPGRVRAYGDGFSFERIYDSAAYAEGLAATIQSSMDKTQPGRFKVAAGGAA